jgi:hypothetical protein
MHAQLLVKPGPGQAAAAAAGRAEPTNYQAGLHAEAPSPPLLQFMEPSYGYAAPRGSRPLPRTPSHNIPTSLHSTFPLRSSFSYALPTDQSRPQYMPLVTISSCAATRVPSSQIPLRVLTVRERRDGALALSDLRLLLNQPPRKLGGSYFFFFLRVQQVHFASMSLLQLTLPVSPLRCRPHHSHKRCTSAHSSADAVTVAIGNAMWSHVEAGHPAS